MYIYPAIDLYDRAAVRLYRGDYLQKTVYSRDPVGVAMDFKAQGAAHIHLVDLEGAKTGGTPNFEVIKEIKKASGLFAEAGGGIRSLGAIERFLDAGIDRVILGTAAAKDESFVKTAVERFGELIAVGADIKDGLIAVNGWTESSGIDAFGFCERMESIGVNTIICTDISRDGAMQGTNRSLYKEMSERFSMNIIASGGVSSIDDIKELAKLDIHGAIIGKAYYTGALSIREAAAAAGEQQDAP